MKIVVCQFYTSNINYKNYSKEINETYCNHNGYTYYTESDDNKISQKLNNRSITWYKPNLIKEVMLKYPMCDYILFSDIDAIFINKERKIEEFITNDFSILMSSDYGPSLVNAGVMLLKNNKLNFELMSKWWDLGEEFPEYKTGLWHDQTCLKFLYDRLEDKSVFKIIDNNDINSNIYDKEKFIFHAFSYGHLPNRTLDLVYNEIFNVEKPKGKELIDIVSYYNTDKHYEHNYFNLIYNDVFKENYLNIKTFIEIGVLNGDSVELWRDYFVNANIIGLDYNIQNTKEKLSNKNLDRITLESIDQSDPTQLDELTKKYNNVDVILDDGSHKMYDQQITFAKTFKMLKSKGIFIIEDLHTSLEVTKPEKAVFGWGDVSKTTTLDMLNNFNVTGKIKSDYLTFEECEYLTNNIESISIYRNRSEWSITSIIIKK